jgi:hypothetical protein
MEATPVSHHFGGYTATLTRAHMERSGTVDARLTVQHGPHRAHFTYEGRWMAQPRKGPPRWTWMPRGQTSDTPGMSNPHRIEMLITEWMTGACMRMGLHP